MSVLLEILQWLVLAWIVLASRDMNNSLHRCEVALAKLLAREHARTESVEASRHDDASHLTLVRRDERADDHDHRD